ncbi:ABC transporter substrate-binding protein [Mycolicibacterium sp. 018/SC-01/001]|uniref:metal ABC transporter solute-binding protein, Zn/Mn family n=1 Tax=Mycolicibacterium sp. 018/SC-01/001 TaxID=2592069 RepID=UPI00117CC2CC|nr:zinc ABC transporter substrate-binding protein [Mycolicibacterium sp. 018/SC-01/001]TRW80007.1 ABC transporter substrate-binding protein [Mycolicibacterium sp. 018/SC-01/001]
MRRAALLGVATMVLLAGTGCSQTPPSSEHGTANVVASTGVWASVAAAVAGPHATVRSLVPRGVDPATFTPDDTAVREVADASLVVYNGGRYDAWLDPILEKSHDIPTIQARTLAPFQPPPDDHVFYDLIAAKAVADHIADSLGGSDAQHADDYTAAADQFDEDLDTLALAQHAIGQAHPGASVVSTTPAAFYAVRNAGIADKTPPAFSAAVAAGAAPSPADVAAVVDLIRSRRVSALVVDAQPPGGAQRGAIDAVTAAARAAALPIAAVTTAPADGVSYLQWQRDTVDQIATAFNRPS